MHTQLIKLFVILRRILQGNLFNSVIGRSIPFAGSGRCADQLAAYFAQR
jgi:hypothetical protein